MPTGAETIGLIGLNQVGLVMEQIHLTAVAMAAEFRATVPFD